MGYGFLGADGAFLVTSLITLFIIYFIRKFVHQPVHTLIAATRAVMDMRLDQPITLHSSRELDQLATSFDTMRGRLIA